MRSDAAYGAYPGRTLDWLPTPEGNTIGALLLHLAAVETYYQFHTFNGLPGQRPHPKRRSALDPP